MVSLRHLTSYHLFIALTLFFQRRFPPSYSSSMTGSSTPTRSCLKRRLQAAKNSISGSLSSTGSSSGSSTKSLCKTVSFDGKEHIYFADPDYDRHSVPVAPKLSYEDLLELKMLNVNMMCPQNSNTRCSGVGIGILPLLPPSEPSSATSTSNNSPVLQPKQTIHSTHSIIGRHLSAKNQHFVGLLDDDLASAYSSTPPPSSPSEHSPNMNVTALPMIATDDEGQLIFQFTDSGDLDDTFDHNIHSRRHESANNVNGSKHAHDLSLNLTTKLAKIEESATAAPFPLPPSKQQNQPNQAAFTLTPSFFALPPQPQPATMPKSDPSESASPFPFAPPVPTTAGLGLPSLPSLSMSASQCSSNKTTPTPSNLASPTRLSHHQHTSSSGSSPTSPQSTPHASPKYATAMHVNMRAASRTGNAPAAGPPTSTNHQTQGQSHPPAGPLAALHLQHLQKHPLSPLLSGVPSPSLAPPSPLSLNPPNLDNTSSTTFSSSSSTTINGVMSAAAANPGGFFSCQKRSSNSTGAHAKRPSAGAPTLRPTSPIVKPLKS